MKEPIFEHGGNSERYWKGVWQNRSDQFLTDLQSAYVRCMPEFFVGDGMYPAAVTLFAIARELERREIAAEKASRQPKFLEQLDQDLYQQRAPGKPSYW